MQKRTIKALCAIMAILMLVPMMFACNNRIDDETRDLGTGDVGSDFDPNKFEVPENHTFDGEKFNILTAGQVAYNDFDFTSEDVTVLGQAQYNRITAILQETKVQIVPTKDEYKSSSAHNAYDKISQQMISGDNTFQLGVIGGYDSALLAESECLMDINSVPVIDTRKVWWDQNANDDLSINGMLFFTNGALTAAYSESTYVIYFNKKLATENLPDGTDMYQLVRDGKWTIDQLAAFSRSVSEDIDGVDGMGPNDRYGLYVWDDSILGMIEAAGTKVVTIGEDGKFALTYNTSTSLEMFNKYTNIAYDSNYAHRYSKTLGAGVINAFQENKGLFWATSNVNTSKIRDMDASFGILPYPKLSEDQDRYYSTIAPYNSQFISIPYTEDEDMLYMIGVVTEYLAYYGEKITWPACYEQTLKGAFARDDGTMDMLDTIYDNYKYDIGLYFQVGGYISHTMNLLRNGLTTFSSMLATYESNAQQKVDDLNATFAKMLADKEG